MNLNSTLSLTSETPLLKEELKRAKTVLQMLYDSNDSAEFREAVDWESKYDHHKSSRLERLSPADKVPHGLRHSLLEAASIKLSFRVVDARRHPTHLGQLQGLQRNRISTFVLPQWIYASADKMEKYFKKLIKNYFSSVAFPQNITKTSKNPENSVSQ